MKRLLSDERAVSVVVGSILVLAILVTFMSVVVSTWVPIYEGNDEAQHSEQAYNSFMKITKQIQNADEYPESTTFDLGTEGSSFIARSNSVGSLELNDTESTMFITTNLTMDISTSDMGYGLEAAGMDTNVTNPITCFRLDLEQGALGGGLFGWTYTNRLHPDFRLQMRTSNSRIWITLYAADIQMGFLGIVPDSARKLGITITHGSSIRDVWNTELSILPNHTEPHGIYIVDNNFSVDFLNKSINLTLNEMKGDNVLINGTTYNTTSGYNTAPLYDLIQHYMKLPALETGDYYIDYVQYTAIAGGRQYFTYNSTEKSAYILVDDNGEMVMVFDGIKAGGGTLTLGSDYNFMVDQSYIYNNGALILKQDDGAIFRVEPPIAVGNNSQGDLVLTLKTTVLNGKYTQSGNGEGTLYTVLDKTYEGSGHTDNVTITMSNTPSELKPIWNSYYEDLNSTISETTAHSRYYPGNMTMHIWDNNPTIMANLQKNNVAITS